VSQLFSVPAVGFAIYTVLRHPRLTAKSFITRDINSKAHFSEYQIERAMIVCISEMKHNPCEKGCIALFRDFEFNLQILIESGKSDAEQEFYITKI
jgi:hypothetical protein